VRHAGEYAVSFLNLLHAQAVGAVQDVGQGFVLKFRAFGLILYVA
jgi:hypothetical protein